MSEARLPELDALRGGKIFVAGHRGMVGSAIVRALKARGCDLVDVSSGGNSPRRGK